VSIAEKLRLHQPIYGGLKKNKKPDTACQVLAVGVEGLVSLIRLEDIYSQNLVCCADWIFIF
jgi:hypothetical protein